ncbi:hypothetical protein BGX28_002902 [Mortierella sp. GBA30]|nr:hypothetical protein BGX28_002902 [Mortierella sp. GBA30]
MASNNLEIPEILLHIARHLSPTELASACRTSRCWFVPFASELWRSIQFDQWTHGALTAALPRYSTFIRELHCPRFTELDRLGPQCTRLTLFKAPEITPHNLDLLTTILERNPDIGDLYLMFEYNWDSRCLPIGLIKALGKLTKLKTLKIEIPWRNSKVLLYLLERLSGLESLTVTAAKMEPLLDLESALMADMHQAQGEPQQQQCQLRHLSIDHFPIVESILAAIGPCPYLESLTLVDEFWIEHAAGSPSYVWRCQELGAHCPRLSELHLVGFSYLLEQELGDDKLTILLTEAFPRLRRFSAKDHYSVEADLLQCLLKAEAQLPGFKETLEHIEIEGTQRPFEDCTPALDSLARLPALKTLSLASSHVHADVMELRLRGGDDWVCKDLEVLELAITNSAHDVDLTIITPLKYRLPKLDQETLRIQYMSLEAFALAFEGNTY